MTDVNAKTLLGRLTRDDLAQALLDRSPDLEDLGDGLGAEILSRFSVDALANAIRSVRSDDDIYLLFDLDSPKNVELDDFPEGQIRDAARGMGMIEADGVEGAFKRDHTLENALDRENFLLETDLARHLERVEDALRAGDLDKAARLLDQFMRPSHRSRFRGAPAINREAAE